MNAEARRAEVLSPSKDNGQPGDSFVQNYWQLVLSEVQGSVVADYVGVCGIDEVRRKSAIGTFCLGSCYLRVISVFQASGQSEIGATGYGRVSGDSIRTYT